MKEGSVLVAESNRGKRHKKYGLGDMFTMRICPMCGKDFVIGDAGTYAYQKQVNGRHQNYCSWGCMRTHLRELGKIE